jgi:hypothetical protein
MSSPDEILVFIDTGPDISGSTVPGDLAPVGCTHAPLPDHDDRPFCIAIHNLQLHAPRSHRIDLCTSRYRSLASARQAKRMTATSIPVMMADHFEE